MRSVERFFVEELADVLAVVPLTSFFVVKSDGSDFEMCTALALLVIRSTEVRCF